MHFPVHALRTMVSVQYSQRQNEVTEIQRNFGGHFAREMKLFWGSPPGLAQGGTPWARIWGTPSETSVWLMVGAFYHGMDVAAQGCRVPPSVAQAVQVTVVVMCILSPSDLGVELVCSLCRWVYSHLRAGEA